MLKESVHVWNGHNKKTPVRISVAACAAVALGLTALPSSSVAAPEPTIEQAKEKVNEAYHVAEQATERYHEITDELRGTNSQIRALRSDVAREQKSFDVLRDQVGASVANQLTSSPTGMTTELLASDDPDEFLDRLSTQQTVNDRQTDRLTMFEQQAKELNVRRAQLDSKVDSVSKAKDKMAEEKTTRDSNVTKAEDVLATLTAAQRATVNADDDHGGDSSDSAPKDGGSSVDLGNIKASPRAKKAIQFALDQLGDAYGYGATGPNQWDCSGLTGAAWRAGGVSLPRSSQQQAGAGSPVSQGAMSPGDLVFYYSPISHVGIYIGDGKLVHASRPGTPVEITSVDSMPINSVRRVG